MTYFNLKLACFNLMIKRCRLSINYSRFPRWLSRRPLPADPDEPQLLADIPTCSWWRQTCSWWRQTGAISWRDEEESSWVSQLMTPVRSRCQGQTSRGRLECPSWWPQSGAGVRARRAGVAWSVPADDLSQEQVSGPDVQGSPGVSQLMTSVRSRCQGQTSRSRLECPSSVQSPDARWEPVSTQLFLLELARKSKLNYLITPCRSRECTLFTVHCGSTLVFIVGQSVTPWGNVNSVCCPSAIFPNNWSSGPNRAAVSSEHFRVCFAVTAALLGYFAATARSKSSALSSQ